MMRNSAPMIEQHDQLAEGATALRRRDPVVEVGDAQRVVRSRPGVPLTSR